MDHQTLDRNAVMRLCNGNVEAVDWIQVGQLYVHEIDDLIDVDLPQGNRPSGAARACRIGALALKLYTHPFWMKHWPALRAVMYLNTLNYQDSVRLENSTVEWQRNFSDWGRHGWMDVCKVVGEICAGYDHVANQSLEILAAAYANHHDGDGKPN